MRNKGFLIALSLLMLVGCGAPAPTLSVASRATFRTEARTEAHSLLVMPQMGNKPILSAIQGAQRSIWLEIYLFTNHDQSGQLLQALVDQAKKGLDVRVMLDPRPFNPSGQNQPSLNQAAIKALEAGGVKVKTSNPKFTFTHEKAMLIDGETAFIMTSNFTASAFTKNREYAVVDRETSDVGEVGKIFEADWNQQNYLPQDPDLVVSPDNSRRKILNLIDSAQSTIRLECEYLTDPEVARHLGNRAKAGVDVQVMLSNHGNNSSATKLLNGQGIAKVAFAKKLSMHAKAIVVDQKEAYVGSENFTANSLDHNREMGILLQDPEIIEVLTKTIDQDWKNG